jgi:hypothetical protein
VTPANRRAAADAQRETATKQSEELNFGSTHVRPPVCSATAAFSRFHAQENSNRYATTWLAASDLADPNFALKLQ